MRLTILSFCLFLTLLGGCGIKPHAVDAPPGVDKNAYPKTYPDPRTDPHP